MIHELTEVLNQLSRVESVCVRTATFLYTDIPKLYTAANPSANAKVQYFCSHLLLPEKVF